MFICSGTLQKVKVGCGERQRTRDSWGAKHIRQGLAQKAWNLVQSLSRSTFQHLSIMKPFNGAFSHSIHLIVQSLSHSVIQSSTHCHSATFPICRLVLVNASYIRTEGLGCIALFMDGNGPNLLTVGLTCAFGFHQNPIHHPQPPSMGPQNEQTHHSTRRFFGISRYGKGCHGISITAAEEKLEDACRKACTAEGRLTRLLSPRLWHMGVSENVVYP